MAALGTARGWSRGLLAGPVGFMASLCVMAGAALYLPRGAAGIDNLVFPVLLFPLIWCALLLYALLDTRLARAWLILSGISLGHVAVIVAHMVSGT